MIPCRSGCANYCDGCHKTCAHWKELQEKNKAERLEKKAYLEYYNQICSTVLRQYYAAQPRFVHR